MILRNGFKIVAVLAIALGLATGCATKPAEEPAAEVDSAYAEARAAILDARAAHQMVDPSHADYATIGKLIADAEAALAAGDTGRAIQLANQARDMARRAMETKAQPAPTGVTSYTVARGDSLWKISGKAEIYGNPYQWPLIYKANRAQIKDADLIFPGQRFNIERNLSQADVDAAVNHARTRGAWSLGVVEESDLRYLAR